MSSRKLNSPKVPGQFLHFSSRAQMSWEIIGRYVLYTHYTYLCAHSSIRHRYFPRIKMFLISLNSNKFLNFIKWLSFYSNIYISKYIKCTFYCMNMFLRIVAVVFFSLFVSSLMYLNIRLAFYFHCD